MSNNGPNELSVSPQKSDAAAIEQSSIGVSIHIHTLLGRVGRTGRPKTLKVSPSQDAMLEHLAYIVMDEHRPATWRDFTHFTVNGRPYTLTQGTIRHYLAALKRKDLIVLSYRSINAYYSLVEFPFTPHPTWVTPLVNAKPNLSHRPDLSDLIERLAYDTPAVHDIHLTFHAPSIYDKMALRAAAASNGATTNTYTATTTNIINDNDNVSDVFSLLSTRPIAKDLVISPMPLDAGIEATPTVHKTDKVSIILACTDSPIKFDPAGMFTLHCSLTRVEERLRKLTLNLVDIPHFSTWVVTMWHVNLDSIERYTGEKFQVVWRDFTGAWVNAYSKASIGVVRLERQEYPRLPFKEAVEQKLRRGVPAEASAAAAAAAAAQEKKEASGNGSA